MTNITNQKPNKGTMTLMNGRIQTLIERPENNLLIEPVRSSASAAILIAVMLASFLGSQAALAKPPHPTPTPTVTPTPTPSGEDRGNGNSAAENVDALN